MSIYLGFNWSNTVDGETTLDIIDQTEEFVSLFNGDNICKLNQSTINLFNYLSNSNLLIIEMYPIWVILKKYLII